MEEHNPTSSEMKTALLDFFFTEGLLCTARQRPFTALNHHRTTILLPRAQGEPPRSPPLLCSPPSSARHRVHVGTTVIIFIPKTVKVGA
jgi:hypothetical protein